MTLQRLCRPAHHKRPYARFVRRDATWKRRGGKEKKAAAPRRPRERHLLMTINIVLPSQSLLRSACSSCVSGCRSVSSSSAQLVRKWSARRRLISGSSGAVSAADGRRRRGGEGGCGGEEEEEGCRDRSWPDDDAACWAVPHPAGQSRVRREADGTGMFLKLFFFCSTFRRKSAPRIFSGWTVIVH